MNKFDALKYETLRKIELFSTVPESTLNLLIKHCKEKELKDGEVLCKEGDIDKRMYIILSGKLLIYKLKRKIDVAGAGQYLGEMLLIDSKPRSASVKAIGDALIMEIDDEIFKKYILPDPQAMGAMLENFCTRTRNHLGVISEDFQKLNILVHDMRNLLTGLSVPEVHMETLANLLQSNKPGQKAREGLTEAKSSLDKLISVKNDLLTLLGQSRAITSNIDSEYIREDFSISHLVEETIEELVHHKCFTGKKLEVNIEDDLPEIKINSLDIKRVLQNLIINAGYVSQKKQIVKVIVFEKGEGIQISVTDMGGGIPEEIQPILMKERYTSKADGNGFGLLSCRQIIEAFHGGKLWFETELGKGSSFHFAIFY